MIAVSTGHRPIWMREVCSPEDLGCEIRPTLTSGVHVHQQVPS